MDDNTPPVTARFYRLIRDIPKPRRADRSADGMIPMRAYRYCQALTTASGFGWYFYPPINFALLLEGDEIFWTYEGADGCYPLGGAQFPGFREFFEDNAPEAAKRLAPPFLTASRQPGVVQIWSGYLAWTAPGLDDTRHGPPSRDGAEDPVDGCDRAQPERRGHHDSAEHAHLRDGRQRFWQVHPRA